MNLTLKSRLGFAGGLLGLVGLGVLAVVLVGQEEPVEGRWRLAALLVVATPYAVATAGAFVERPEVRGAWLLASGLASFVITGLLAFSVGVVFMPATVALLIAAGRSVGATGWPRGWAVLRLLGALVAAALLIGALLVFVISPTSGCWQTVRYADGSRATRSIPCDGSPRRLDVGGTVSTERGSGTVVGWYGTSNAVTARVAGLSLVAMIAGVLVLLGVAGIGTRRRVGGRDAPA